VAAFRQNQWQLSSGIGGSFAVESVATFEQNTQRSGDALIGGPENDSTDARGGYTAEAITAAVRANTGLPMRTFP
jgi:hypothetical protein